MVKLLLLLRQLALVVEQVQLIRSRPPSSATIATKLGISKEIVRRDSGQLPARTRRVVVLMQAGGHSSVIFATGRDTSSRTARNGRSGLSLRRRARQQLPQANTHQ